ncbi:envelope glycoprotein N [Testudinid alphaherpesvirus 3]|uniref:Envelope glycoprotein N n=1 Tax=Testudinid alphaherpesvirus 3 TaxID=2560801 RepID=A0A0K1R1A2_9ALPH|nr:envelope glycoprotein N [Testudinid alphaherpesvirus 3]AIU39335.1 envelope glycoprotein N [Testudinid alphaherpesvirus 3]AIU39430.1 envelope glycoprotein N [Testudinid alphaherpesvirus 3]AKI81705.1 envelope glycoprotein N [Testudinid alphaherpesvirus 3]AKI81806.1 envelope glycoprotein N [Testudinid alphaherpesvirus 3]AKV40722.1 UL49.5 tegument/envelope protein [Testudinid alphaherpesvirus 3]
MNTLITTVCWKLVLLLLLAVPYIYTEGATPVPPTVAEEPSSAPNSRFMEFTCSGSDYYLEHITFSSGLFIFGFCIMLLSTILALYSCCFHMFVKEMALKK